MGQWTWLTAHVVLHCASSQGRLNSLLTWEEANARGVLPYCHSGSIKPTPHV